MSEPISLTPCQDFFVSFVYVMNRFCSKVLVIKVVVRVYGDRDCG